MVVYPARRPEPTVLLAMRPILSPNLVTLEFAGKLFEGSPHSFVWEIEEPLTLGLEAPDQLFARSQYKIHGMARWKPLEIEEPIILFGSKYF